VGGNKILVEDKETKVLLDFGMSFAERDRFYSDPWLSPRNERDLLEFGILPQIEGAYIFDQREPAIEGVLLSHSHLDHSRHISFLKEGTHIHLGEATSNIIHALNSISKKGFETDVSHLQFATFRTGDKIKVGSFEIEPVHVDHSVPGSYGYIIHTSDGSIAYTGDLRTHGPRPDLTREFVERAAASEPVAMISEGTNFGGAVISSEPQVRKEIDSIVSSVDKVVLASFSYGDIDRLRTFYQVAKENSRYLAISLKQAYLLKSLSRDPHLDIPALDDPALLIFRRAKKHYYEWEQELLRSPNICTATEIRALQEKVILVCSFLDFKELIDIRPEPGSTFILSQSEPFNEEMEIEYQRLMNWLDHFGLPMYHAHCSGHVTPNELKRAVETIKPRQLFPVHTEHPNLFAKFLSKTTDVRAPQKNVVYRI